MQVEAFIKIPTPGPHDSPRVQRRVIFDGWSREEILADMPRLAAALDVDLTDVDFDTLVVRNLRT